MRRTAGGEDEGAGALEIEFEDGEGSPEPDASPAVRPRDLRPAALIVLAAAMLCAFLAATHRTGSSDANDTTVTTAVPNYAAFVVTVEYRSSRLLSLSRRQIEVDLRITPMQGARVTILNYYENENGVVSSVGSALPTTPLPASGTDVKLELTVTDCTVVPIGESMGSVDVVADGQDGVIDRFTILGERYTTDVARLLRAVCPGRASSQNPFTSTGRVTGP